MGDFRIIEHTADVGLEATGEDLAELFRQATLALLDISGASSDDPTQETFEIDQEAQDAAALLVYWLEEVLYAQDAKDAVITSIEISAIDERTVRGRVGLRPRTEEEAIEGTAVKAITYHGLTVEQADGRWFARVYVDI